MELISPSLTLSQGQYGLTALLHYKHILGGGGGG